MTEKYAAKAAWAKANPEKAAKLELFFSGKSSRSELGCHRTESRRRNPCRHLPPYSVHLATQVENMIVASADLSNSDKTDGFLEERRTHSRKEISAVHSFKQEFQS